MKIISDLPGVQCMVDNIVVAAETFSQLIHRLYVLFQRLEKNNVTVSIKTFEIARSLDVAGMNVTCNDAGVEFRPAADSLNAFARLREPSCKKELQSLLGMVNTFRSWYVKIAPNTTHLRTLLQKGAVWKWDIFHLS